jgi:type I restriction-modification system DNA methylase subunit
LGDAYEYLIGQFAAGGGKKAGEFYTPQQVSTILSRIVSFDSHKRRRKRFVFNVAKRLLQSSMQFIALRSC